MELIAYIEETNEVCYECEVCDKVNTIDTHQFPIFKY